MTSASAITYSVARGRTLWWPVTYSHARTQLPETHCMLRNKGASQAATWSPDCALLPASSQLRGPVKRQPCCLPLSHLAVPSASSRETAWFRESTDAQRPPFKLFQARRRDLSPTQTRHLFNNDVAFQLRSTVHHGRPKPQARN